MSDRRQLVAIGAAAFLLAAWNGAARADGGLRAEPVPLLVALDPIAVPIIDHGEMLGRLELRAMWQSPDQAGADAAQARLPQLRAALVEASASHARLAAAPSRAVDPTALSDALEKAAQAAGFSGELLVLQASARAG